MRPRQLERIAMSVGENSTFAVKLCLQQVVFVGQLLVRQKEFVVQ